MGAWIETLFGSKHAADKSSHPEWVRGLKPSVFDVRDKNGKSHPEWVRGLKPI